MAKKKSTSSSAPTTVLLGGQTVTVPASFGFPTTKSASTPQLVQKQVAAVAQAVTQVVANTPAVIDTPKGKAPKPEEIKPIVQQTVQTVAPIIAPYLPPTALQNIANNVETAIVSSPEIKKADTGQTILPQAINKIAESAIKNFTTANIGGTAVTAPASFGLPASSITSTPYTTTNVGGTNITTPVSFGLPTTSAQTQTSIVEPTPTSATVTETTSAQNNNLQNETVDEGLPRIITGSSTVIPRGKSGMSLAKEAAIEARKLREEDEKEKQSKKVVSTFTNSKGEQVAVYDDGSTTIIGQATDQTGERKSAFDLLKQEFTRYGLGALVGDTLALAQEGISPSEFSLRLRQTEPYKARFAANETRIKNGLSALSEAQYVALEDRYQQIMKEYGVPKSFYEQQVDPKTGIMKQPELEKIIAGDVSPVELETRINTAINRVKNASPEVMSALQQFYPGVTQENLVAYVLDPVRALPDIQRQVQAAEVGSMATRFGLAASRASAEQLAAAGVTKEQAQQGYQTIAEMLPRGSQLAEIYKQSPYNQTTAEQEVFGTAGATEAAKQRKKLTQLESAAFSGQSGMGALARDRAGAF